MRITETQKKCTHCYERIRNNFIKDCTNEYCKRWSPLSTLSTTITENLLRVLSIQLINRPQLTHASVTTGSILIVIGGLFKERGKPQIRLPVWEEVNQWSRLGAKFTTQQNSQAWEGRYRPSEVERWSFEGWTTLTLTKSMDILQEKIRNYFSKMMAFPVALAHWTPKTLLEKHYRGQFDGSIKGPLSKT